MPFDTTQDARYKTPAGPVHQITADDMVQLRPSPKKRAVSRGHYGNIPHPSPVYHCTTTGTHSSAATTAAASALTASSACFLQPLEQASISYASSRYQQQRYDPHVSRGGQGEAGPRGMPRATTSIPSFRGPVLENSPSATSPAGNLSSSRSSAKYAERCVLRHQSTLPDFSQLSKPAVSSATHLPSRTLSRPETHADSCKSASADMAVTAYSLRPRKPPLARLASNSSYAADSSPVHTLVYEGCSPAIGNAHHVAGTAAYARQPTCSMGDSSTAPLTPAYALTSLSADAQGLTLSEATGASGSKHHNGDSANVAIYADVSCAPTANGLQTEHAQAAASGSSGSGTGWHL
ncbi:hypothetical protein IWW47_005053, partial [Coemansia sp. RSA 2052]